MLQVRAAQEAAAAARAEAQAIRESADAKERELRASGELTTSKQAEIEAQRKSAELKDLEAKRADILAYKTRELGNIQNSRTDQAVTGYAREENALRQIAQASRDAEAAERSRAEAAAEAERKRLNMDKEGFTTDSSGNRIAMGGDLSTLTGIAAFLKAAGVDDEAEARRIAKEFANEKGEVQYLNNAGQIKYGGRSSTLSQAVLKAAETYTFSDKNTKASSIPSQTQTININLNGKSTAVTVATANDAAALKKILEDLADAAGRT